MSSVICLASGVDALYLTGSGCAPPELVDLLAIERECAARVRHHGKPYGSVWFGSHEFEVGWGGWGNYRYRLTTPDDRALIGLVPTSDAFPLIRVEPRARFLHAVGPQAVIEWVQDVAATLGIDVEWKVSRLDLFADFHGLGLSAETRWDFVCKGKRRKTFEDGDDLETLYFGSGKPVMARLYDKTKESASKGTDWWPDIWGADYRHGEQVWRIEFQVDRAYLKDVGLSSPEMTLASATRLWQKLTSEWLTLRTPTEDSNRSRWPLAPGWPVVQAVEVHGPPVGEELVRAGQRRGDLRKLTPMVVGNMASLAALLDLHDADELLARLPLFLAADGAKRGVKFRDRVAVKRHEYGVAS